MNLSSHFKGLCEAPDEFLLEEVIKAHYASAANNENLSKQIVAAVGLGSGDVFKAIAAAILSLGGLHGPLLEARKLLREATPQKIRAILSNKKLRIPGWGNSFFKDRIDPSWDGVVTILRQKPIWTRIEMINLELKNQGKNIFPNPAALTAASLEEMKWLEGTEIILPLVARLPVWGLEFNRVMQSLPTIAQF